MGVRRTLLSMFWLFVVGSQPTKSITLKAGLGLASPSIVLQSCRTGLIGLISLVRPYQIWALLLMTPSHPQRVQNPATMPIRSVCFRLHLYINAFSLVYLRKPNVHVIET